MTIASALDLLNDKLAGSDQPASQTIEGMILRLIDNIDQGGGTIPVASADTLGGIKVGENLSITSSGVLSATGGGGGLVVHLDADDDTKLDKTAGEIMEAAQAGHVAFSISGSGMEGVTSLVTAMNVGGSYMFAFSTVDQGSIKLVLYTASSADSKPTQTA